MVYRIIYYSEKKFPKSWNCDCKWFSLKQKFCKHILAIFLRLIYDLEFHLHFSE
ncbi:MAG: SWIM zinc finger family protein [Candidatus Hodarchaeota archaeon]